MNDPSNPSDNTPPVVRPKTRWGAVIVVLCLVVILTVVVLQPRCSSSTAQVAAATLQIAYLGIALDSFKDDNGYFPGGATGLIYLTQKPLGATNWQGPYMERFVLDPWGHAYIYECPGRHNPQTFDLRAMSPDGEEICNWKKK